jgi:aldose 1-epimerase
MLNYRGYCLPAILVPVLMLQSTPRPAARSTFGKLPDGTPVEAFTLVNRQGVELRLSEYGAAILSLRAPDRDGRLVDVVLGFDTLEGYLDNRPHFGVVVGRYANRIAKGRFTLDGKTYQLATNNGPNHLHGGTRGFDRVLWTGEPARRQDGLSVGFTRTSPDGEEAYPGALTVGITYTLTDRNEVIVEYLATTDKPTIVNLSQHSYFNLTGGSRDILGHQVTIEADRYTPVDETLIPTGELAPVEGTPFDFRRPFTIGARIDEPHQQLKYGRGYDHNFILNRRGADLSRAVRVVEPESGRTLEISTTEPGLQFYTGNFLDGTITGKGGRVYARRSGFCLETQHFPDSPNHTNFPSTVLRPGQEYRSRTVFTFGVTR